MKWLFVLVFIGVLMAKDNLATQTDNVLVVVKEKPPMSALPNRTNNWMSVQGNDTWEGLSDEQVHDRQLKFDSPEYGIRAGAISLITRALRKNNKPEVNFSQIFFEEDGWAEDKESYKLDAMSKGFSDDYKVDVMDREQLSTLINFISNHEMGLNEYLKLNDRVGVINKGIDMAYDYVTSDDYSLKDLVK
tara:strand:- start:52 stop:621 length:570 start_codon:yes stop_codon:yes gene_type:complete